MRQGVKAVIAQQTPTIDQALERLVGLHDHLCPRQVLGIRIGLRAAAFLGVTVPQTDKRLVAFVETDGCFSDGVMAATGCSMGHRTMRLVDHGKVAVTLLDTVTHQAVRVWPQANARERAVLYAPDALDHWHAQRDGYRDMPDGELLEDAPVHVLQPPTYDGHHSAKVRCEACGEDVVNEREIRRVGQILCRACAGENYVLPGKAFTRSTS